MKSPQIILTFGLIFSLTSCFMKVQEKHQDFMNHCDCFVYENEVKSEIFSFGRVEFIDTSIASGCVKEQLKNVYLLHYDTICVAVYNIHPKNNIKLVEELIKKYQTDTTRLSDFVKFDSSIRITVDRLCKDKNDNIYKGKYVWWRDIEYSTMTKPYQKTKDELLQTWYKWTE
jgi:hypothetical protein